MNGGPPVWFVFYEDDPVFRIRNAPVNFLVFLHPFFCGFLCHCVIHEGTGREFRCRERGVRRALYVNEVFGGGIGRVHLGFVKKV